MKNRNRGVSKASSSYATETDIRSVGSSAVVIPAAEDQSIGSAPSAPSGNGSPSVVVLPHEHIAERAKAIWLASGCVPGRDEQNWHEAEAQLRAELRPR